MYEFMSFLYSLSIFNLFRDFKSFYQNLILQRRIASIVTSTYQKHYFLKMQELTEHERISLLMMCGWDDRQRSYKEVGLLFNETF